MQRHSALTFQFPSACWICYFIPSHSAWEGFVLAPGGLLLPLSTLHTMPWQRFSEMPGKFKVHRVGHLSGPIFTAYISESAQYTSSSMDSSPWSRKIFRSSASTLSNYSWPLVHHNTKTGSENLDTQPEITAGGRMQQLQHHFCTDVPLHSIILNYSHTKIPWSLSIHTKNSR